jgi:hypothetical protein
VPLFFKIYLININDCDKKFNENHKENNSRKERLKSKLMPKILVPTARVSLRA